MEPLLGQGNTKANKKGRPVCFYLSEKGGERGFALVCFPELPLPCFVPANSSLSARQLSMLVTFSLATASDKIRFCIIITFDFTSFGLNHPIAIK